MHCVVVHTIPSASDRAAQSDAARNALHHALRHLDVLTPGPPGQLHLVRGPRGKPAVALEGVAVSLSHTPSLAVAAASIGTGQIGVDVEACRPLSEAGLRASILSPRERATPDLLRAWVRKESVSKATGDGLWADARLINVDSAGAVGPVIPYPGQTLYGWVQNIDVGAAHRAAITVLDVPRPPNVLVIALDD